MISSKLSDWCGFYKYEIQISELSYNAALYAFQQLVMEDSISEDHIAMIHCNLLYVKSVSIVYDSIVYSFARGFNAATLMDIRDIIDNSFTTCYRVVKWRVISSRLSDPEL